MSAGRLVAIAIRAATRVPMQALESARISPQAGVCGDFRGRPGPRQVTVLSEEAWQDACRELGADLPWTLRRANLLVRGLDLEASVGARLRVGEATLEVTEEADPCRVMDAQHPGLRAALEPHWRGGVCSRVIEGGVVDAGATVTLDRSVDVGE